MPTHWDIGPLTDRQLEVTRTALQAFLESRQSRYTDSQRSVAKDVDEKCLKARLVAELPNPLTPVAGAVGRDHPETSHESAELVAPSAAVQRGRVLAVLHLVGPTGCNAAHVARCMSMAPNQVATRLQELRRGGWVEYVRDDDGIVEKRPTGRGEHRGRVQRLTLRAQRDLDGE